MRQLRVVVTGIGGPTAQGVLRGLQERQNVYIIGADRRSVTTGNQFCDKVVKIPRYTKPDEYKKAIQDIIAEERIDAIFPCLHEEIDLFREFRDELNAAVALPVCEDFDALMDKEKSYEYLAKRGLDRYIPKYFGYNTAEELREIMSQFFPGEKYVVSKNISGYGAMGFAILTDRQNFLKALKEGKPKVVNIDDFCEIQDDNRKIAMEYMGGMEFSVDVFVYDGKVIVSVPRERTGVSSGIVLDGLVVENKELIQASTEIAECLITEGFINFQFITTDDGYKLTDVNARFCGSQVMSLGAGVNFPYLFLQYKILNEKVTVHPRWNTRMLRFREPLFIYEESHAGTNKA
ncbi:ATP-grasp domain-containing protein [Planococcus lenghuensis]|uniref:ATP-grasp domain-containing protein n=1 Tax=Planococcus lenghuensis TaxID=2213202 RepID=A0A1Q2KZC1_9BACL|nr:ATP-grasp domain-containing protein [Planococcus lenghuensis]AQQ53548.1 hypothetical protein B0X71_11005 [Planococcus lenghuensis]